MKRPFMIFAALGAILLLLALSLSPLQSHRPGRSLRITRTGICNSLRTPVRRFYAMPLICTLPAIPGG